ncbi:MAG: SDR family NAD(P)-dependent oxidoreductase, partial [Alphaproteobacteria bacterium]
MTNKRLSGRIALVTGASRGIGRAVARRFAAEGARLILVARTSGGLEEADDEVRNAGGEPAMLVPLDLCQGDLVDQLGAALHERFGRLDILVGNAAMLGGLRPVGHYPPDVWEN